MSKPGEISNNFFKPDHGKVEKKAVNSSSVAFLITIIVNDFD